MFEFLPIGGNVTFTMEINMQALTIDFKNRNSTSFLKAALTYR